MKRCHKCGEPLPKEIIRQLGYKNAYIQIKNQYETLREKIRNCNDLEKLKEEEK